MKYLKVYSYKNKYTDKRKIPTEMPFTATITVSIGINSLKGDLDRFSPHLSYSQKAYEPTRNKCKIEPALQMFYCLHGRCDF